MRSVRLVVYRDVKEDTLSERTYQADTLFDAIYAAVCAGYRTGLAFHVMEPVGAPLRLWWNGLAHDHRIDVPLECVGDPQTRSGETIAFLIRGQTGDN